MQRSKKVSQLPMFALALVAILFSAFPVSAASVPAAPSNLSASAVSQTQINLAWTDNSTNETGFKIERGTDGINFSQIATVGANVTTYPSTGLSANSTYYYRVRAYNTKNSGYSNTASATTLPTVPSAPTVLGASVVSQTQINLAWTDNSTNETGFKIERGTSTSNFVQIATVGANETTYSATYLDPNTTYYFRVRAYNAGGNSTYSNNASATTLAYPPAAPSDLSAYVNTSTSTPYAVVSWTDNSNNETAFTVERSVNSTDNFSVVYIIGTNGTYYYDLDISSGNTYYYRVRASNTGGYSEYSNTYQLDVL